MKKAMLVLLVVVAVGAMASAQDVLGAHLGYGRGCVMCHAPHSGPAGNNKATNDAQAGEFALWGQDLTPLYGQPLTFSGDGKATLRGHPAGEGHHHQRARRQHHHPVLPELP